MNLEHIDFLRKPGPPLAGWLCLGLGTALLSTSLALERHWREQATSLKLQIAQADEAFRRQKAAEQAHSTLPALASRRLAQWQVRQSIPWQGVLTAVDASTAPPVHLLGLTWQIDSSGRTAQLKLDAQAAEWEDALVFANHLQGLLNTAAAPLQADTQVSSQQLGQDTGNGEQVQRFSIKVPLHSTPLTSSGPANRQAEP